MKILIPLTLICLLPHMVFGQGSTRFFNECKPVHWHENRLISLNSIFVGPLVSENKHLEFQEEITSMVKIRTNNAGMQITDEFDESTSAMLILNTESDAAKLGQLYIFHYSISWEFVKWGTDDFGNRASISSWRSGEVKGFYDIDDYQSGYAAYVDMINGLSEGLDYFIEQYLLANENSCS